MLKRTRHFFRYRHRRWLAAGSAALGMLVFSGASVKLTSKSSFCKSCHLMESYHATWMQDAHNKIECVQCHIAPGVEHMVHAKLDGFAQMVNNILGRASTRPAAHVSDNACTRSGCHVAAELAGARAERPYLFDHQAHLELKYKGIKVHCTTCHSYIRGDVHFEVNTNACFTCHLLESGSVPSLAHAGASGGINGAPLRLADSGQNGGAILASAGVGKGETLASADCRTCHDAPTELIHYRGLVVNHTEYLEYGASCTSCHQGLTSAPAAVEDSRCLSCHGFGIERKLDTTELHRVHAEARHKVQCFNCHGLLQHGPQVRAAMSEQLDCRACHTDSHQLQRTTYQHLNGAAGQLAGSARNGGLTGVDQMPVSPMYLAHVACTSCHVEPDQPRTIPSSGGMVARATPEACDTCHRPGLGERTIPLWQRTTRELYQSVVELMPSAQRRETASDEARALLHEAEQLLEVVRLDGSWGVHNPRYTERLLEEARTKVLRARALVGVENGSRNSGEGQR
jgi:nitrate/TMAO reductase-like tetraheme cytochrome c subunit